MALGALALAGCAGVDSGQAAVSDAFRVSQAEVDAQVREVVGQVQQAPGDPQAGVALGTAQRLVQDALTQAKAAELGVSVTEAEVQAGVAELRTQYGDQATLEQAAAEANIPASQIDDFVRNRLLVERIGAELGGGVAEAGAALGEYSQAVGVEISPRYGTWDPATLQIVPGSAVAEPAASPAAG
jgi:hypothetical protein